MYTFWSFVDFLERYEWYMDVSLLSGLLVLIMLIGYIYFLCNSEINFGILQTCDILMTAVISRSKKKMKHAFSTRRDNCKNCVVLKICLNL